MGITITIKGPHNSGKTTAANLIKMFLEENGYQDVKVEDLPPLSVDEKPQFWDRFVKNRERSVLIRVELEP
jgi:type IV secretory pathway ATPase VirB11/archaellum biosynthesis ATPase